MLDYLKNFWNNAFGGCADGPIFGYQPPSNPLPPPPSERPAPSPEPSCFAKGIAASLRDQPNVWIEVESDEWVKLSMVHLETKSALAWHVGYYRPKGASFAHGLSKDIITLDGLPLEDIDAEHIISVIKAHPLGQYKEEMDRVKVEEARQAAAKARFESLGCSPSP